MESSGVSLWAQPVQEMLHDLMAYEQALGAPPVEPERDEVEQKQGATDQQAFTQGDCGVFPDDKNRDQVQQREDADANRDLPDKGTLELFRQSGGDRGRGKIQADRHRQAQEKKREQSRGVGEWPAQSFVGDDGPEQQGEVTKRPQSASRDHHHRDGKTMPQDEAAALPNDCGDLGDTAHG